MTGSQIFGAAVFAAGILLMAVGYNSTQAPVEEFANRLTGRYSDQTMWYIIVGIAATVGGGLVAVFGTRR